MSTVCYDISSQDLLARDCVLVFSGDVNKFPYVGRIVSLWQDSGSGMKKFVFGIIQAASV